MEGNKSNLPKSYREIIQEKKAVKVQSIAEGLLKKLGTKTYYGDQRDDLGKDKKDQFVHVWKDCD